MLRTTMNFSNFCYSRPRYSSSCITCSIMISMLPQLLLTQYIYHNIYSLSNGGGVNSAKPSTVRQLTQAKSPLNSEKESHQDCALNASGQF